MPLQFETVEDAQLRLGGSVILYEKELIAVESVQAARVDPKTAVRETGYFMCYTLLNNRDKYLYRNIKKETIENQLFSLGYCNREGTSAVFVHRIPVRIYKMGLCGRNVSISSGQNPCNFPSLCSEKGFPDMLNSIYPSFQEAVVMSTENRFSVAFSKDFLLRRSSYTICQIYHQEELVAEYDLKKLKILLYPKAKHLKEKLERCKTQTEITFV